MNFLIILSVSYASNFSQISFWFTALCTWTEPHDSLLPTTIFIFIFYEATRASLREILDGIKFSPCLAFSTNWFSFYSDIMQWSECDWKFSPYCTSATIKKKKVVIAQFFHVQSNAHFMIFYVQQVKLLLSIAAFYFFSSKEMTLNFLLWWSSSFWVTEKIIPGYKLCVEWFHLSSWNFRGNKETNKEQKFTKKCW